jgi:hypothetical protein
MVLFKVPKISLKKRKKLNSQKNNKILENLIVIQRGWKER